MGRAISGIKDQLARYARRFRERRCAGSHGAPTRSARAASRAPGRASPKAQCQRDVVASRFVLPDDRGTIADVARRRAGSPPDAAWPKRRSCRRLGLRRAVRRARRWWKLRTAYQAAARHRSVARIFDDQMRHQQRVAAEIEEVVIDADALEPERLGQEPRKHLLRRRPRWGVVGAACWSGAGRALRSSLPLGVSGSASSTTNAAGTM